MEFSDIKRHETSNWMDTVLLNISLQVRLFKGKKHFQSTLTFCVLGTSLMIATIQTTWKSLKIQQVVIFYPKCAHALRLNRNKISSRESGAWKVQIKPLFRCPPRPPFMHKIQIQWLSVFFILVFRANIEISHDFVFVFSINEWMLHGFCINTVETFAFL